MTYTTKSMKQAKLDGVAWPREGKIALFWDELAKKGWWLVLDDSLVEQMYGSETAANDAAAQLNRGEELRDNVVEAFEEFVIVLAERLNVSALDVKELIRKLLN